MNVILTPVQVRVLGCLIEKAITTPEYYPLTLNALTAACNQKSNRDPVMALDDRTVMEAVDELRSTHSLVWQVDIAGSRTPKFKHNAADTLGLSANELAVLCELMIRGPQTLGELRTHTGRLCAFASLTEVEDTLRKLQERPEQPLAVKLAREPGRREQRYAHLLCGNVPAESSVEAPPAEPEGASPAPARDRLAALEAQVAALRKDVDALNEQFAQFRRQFE